MICHGGISLQLEVVREVEHGSQVLIPIRKDKQAIIGMISKFSNGGSAAFERRMVTVVHDIVFEKTGHAIGGRRRLLPKAYSMGDIAQKSKAPKSNAVDEAAYPVRV